MTLKYSFKLIFLQFIFKFMISTAPQASNGVNGREKCLNLFFRCEKKLQGKRGPVVWQLTCPAGDNLGVSSNLGLATSFTLYIFWF